MRKTPLYLLLNAVLLLTVSNSGGAAQGTARPTDLRPEIKLAGQSLEASIRRATLMATTLDQKTRDLRSKIPAASSLLSELDSYLVQNPKSSLLAGLEDAQTKTIQGLQDVSQAPIGSCNAAKLSQWQTALSGADVLKQVTGNRGRLYDIMTAATQERLRLDALATPILNQLRQSGNGQAYALTQLKNQWDQDLYQIALLMYRDIGASSNSLANLPSLLEYAQSHNPCQAQNNPSAPHAGVVFVSDDGTPKLTVQGGSNLPGVKQTDLNTLQVSQTGDLYRMVTDHPWYAVADPSKNIQKAVPVDGAMYNNQGQFIGQWQTVLQAKADSYSVVTDKSGQNHIYTFQWSGLLNSGDLQVSRDGNVLTSIKNGPAPGTSLAQAKVGGDGNLYAQFTKENDDANTQEDDIVKIDPSGGQYRPVAQVPRYYHTIKAVKYWHGVDDFQVDSNGRVFTLYKGDVFQQNDGRGRTMAAGSMDSSRDLSDPNHIPEGNVDAFQLDAHGNMYTASAGHITVNNSKTADIDAGPNAPNFRLDNQGNVYYAQQVWLDQYLKKRSLLLDPSGKNNAASAPSAAE